VFYGGFQNTPFEHGPGTYSDPLPVAALRDPIYRDFRTSAFTRIRSGRFQTGANVTLTARLANAVVLGEVTVEDEAGNPIGEWQIRADRCRPAHPSRCGPASR
jgi:hypothetical protein